MMGNGFDKPLEEKCGLKKGDHVSFENGWNFSAGIDGHSSANIGHGIISHIDKSSGQKFAYVQMNEAAGGKEVRVKVTRLTLEEGLSSFDMATYDLMRQAAEAGAKATLKIMNVDPKDIQEVYRDFHDYIFEYLEDYSKDM